MPFASGSSLALRNKMSEEKKETPHYRADREIFELYKEMKKIGLGRFREMFGQEMIEQFKGFIADEKRLIPIRNKILLQGKLKCDYPMCEKCVNWGGASAGSKRCPYDELEKRIIFEKGELAQNPFPVEVCEKFVWKKDK